MPQYCSFDQLPLVILYTLFSYFSAGEILSTFHNVSDYVNNILQSYSSYQLDFKSISKSGFRRVCHHVRPEQVISLTLSDSNDTPGQSNLFFSRFRIEQFIRLRSLKLVEIEYNSLEPIFFNLPKLYELRSFSFNALSIRFTCKKVVQLDLRCSNPLDQINSMLRNTYAQVFSQLNYLELNGGWVLDSIPLRNLLYLKLTNCPVDKLETITQSAPELRSLDISIIYRCANFEVILLPYRLIRLHLKIPNFAVSMNSMECLLLNRSNLKYLQLLIMGINDLTDGQCWQRLTKSLITFNFMFGVHLTHIEQTLDSFRTPFWLKEKHWFVAYEDMYLFSVPYGASEHIDTSYQPPIHCTAPDNTVFYENVTKLDVAEAEIFSKRFTRVNHLELRYSISQRKLSRFIDLHHIKHLSILFLKDLLQFPSLKRNMSCLTRLTIKNMITTETVKQMINNSYEQIRSLEIGNNFDNQPYIIEELARLFPYTEQLLCKSDIQTIDIMTHFIDEFKYLLNASFSSCDALLISHGNYICDPNLIILRTNRLICGITMCRIYRVPIQSSIVSIDWWIEN